MWPEASKQRESHCLGLRRKRTQYIPQPICRSLAWLEWRVKVREREMRLEERIRSHVVKSLDWT